MNPFIPPGRVHNLYQILKRGDDSKKDKQHRKGSVWVLPALKVWDWELRQNVAHLSRQKGTHTIMWT